MSPRRRWIFVAWLGALCGVLASGCQCVGIVRHLEGTTPSTGQGTDLGRVPTAPTTPPGIYQIRGVAMVAFYPGLMDDDRRSVDPTTGTMNGYLILYSALQQTEIAAWRLRDGQCESTVQSHEPSPDDKTPPVIGLDGGKAVRAELNGVAYDLERRENPPPKGATTNVIYNFPTVNEYQFPYQQQVQFASEGQVDFPAFQIALQAPARLDVLSPKLTAAGLRVSRGDGLALRWRTRGEMPYVAIRINQRDDDAQQTRSLLCRFANTGEGTIPAASLSAFAADPDGKRTQIFFSPTTYKLAPIPGFAKPILAVVRATTTLPVVVE